MKEVENFINSCYLFEEEEISDEELLVAIKELNKALIEQTKDPSRFKIEDTGNIAYFIGDYEFNVWINLKSIEFEKINMYDSKDYQYHTIEGIEGDELFNKAVELLDSVGVEFEFTRSYK